MKNKIKEFSEKHSVKIKIYMLNTWEEPDEYWRRGWNQLIINSKIIKSFYSTTEFNEEIEAAVKNQFQ